LTLGYPLDRIFEEVAFLAYHFHWSYTELLNMEHRERQKWCNEVSKLNKRISDQK
jgi:hypothetical protein